MEVTGANVVAVSLERTVTWVSKNPGSFRVFPKDLEVF